MIYTLPIATVEFETSLTYQAYAGVSDEFITTLSVVNMPDIPPTKIPITILPGESEMTLISDPEVCRGEDLRVRVNNLPELTLESKVLIQARSIETEHSVPTTLYYGTVIGEYAIPKQQCQVEKLYYYRQNRLQRVLSWIGNHHWNRRYQELVKDYDLDIEGGIIRVGGAISIALVNREDVKGLITGEVSEIKKLEDVSDLEGGRVIKLEKVMVSYCIISMLRVSFLSING